LTPSVGFPNNIQKLFTRPKKLAPLKQAIVLFPIHTQSITLHMHLGPAREAAGTAENKPLDQTLCLDKNTRQANVVCQLTMRLNFRVYLRLTLIVTCLKVKKIIKLY